VEHHACGEFFGTVVPFRGSYLEMLLALKLYNNREDPDCILIYMPGHTEETIGRSGTGAGESFPSASGEKGGIKVSCQEDK